MKYLVYGVIAVVALVAAGRCLLSSAANQAGIEHAEQGESDRAVEEFTKAIEIEDSNATLYSNRAWTNRDIGNYRQAVLDFDKAIELDSDDADSYGGRRLSHLDLGDPWRAIEDFDKAIELEPREAVVKGGAIPRCRRFITPLPNRHKSLNHSCHWARSKARRQ